MKIKSSFIGVAQDVPQKIKKSFSLNDRYHSATISVSFLGQYILDVPYGITDATARRSMLYKQTMAEITQQMIDAYSQATESFTCIACRCPKIKSDILFKKQLDNLSPETYKRKRCPEPQPTKQSIRKELEEEASRRFYKLFSSNESQRKQFVDDNLDKAYTERLRHWEEVITYFDYVDSVIEAKKNKSLYQAYLAKKTELENMLYGPDTYIRKQLNEIVKDDNLPLRVLPFDFEYKQKEGLVTISVDLDSSANIPKEFAQTYANGKLWVKSKGKEYIAELQDFYIGLPFYIACKMFGLALNIQKVSVSVVDLSSRIGYIWIEFEREILRQFVINDNTSPSLAALSYNHVFDLDNLTGLRNLPIEEFNQRVKYYISKSSVAPQNNLSPMPSPLIDISVSDAKVLASSIYANQELHDAIKQAEQSGRYVVSVSKAIAAMLGEIKTSEVLPDDDTIQNPNLTDLSAYEPVEYVEYNVVENIEESDVKYLTQMRSFIERVINAEAPISRDVLNRRICAAMSISRVSARLSETISEIIAEIKPISTFEGKQFFWSLEVRPETFKAYRIGGNRDSLDITPLEVANCVICKLRDQDNYNKSQLLRDIANEFGFSRMGTNVVSTMEKGLSLAISKGLVFLYGEMVKCIK